jgi:hypothetical protein
VPTWLLITAIYLPSFFLGFFDSLALGQLWQHFLRLDLSDDPMAARRMFSLKTLHPYADLRRTKIVVIGTGLTVVSTAAHCMWYMASTLQVLRHRAEISWAEYGVMLAPSLDFTSIL